MDARDPETYVYYFALALMLFGVMIWCVAPFLPIEQDAYFRISVMGLAFMFLSFFMFTVIGKGFEKDGKATSNKTESKQNVC